MSNRSSRPDAPYVAALRWVTAILAASMVQLASIAALLIGVIGLGFGAWATERTLVLFYLGMAVVLLVASGALAVCIVRSPRGWLVIAAAPAVFLLLLGG